MKNKAALLLGSSLALIITATTTYAQVMTFDTQVATEVSRAAANSQAQVSRLTDIKQIATETLEAIGEYGPRQNADNPQWEAEFSQGGTIAEILKEIKPNTCAIVACLGDGGGEEADLDSIETAREWINKSFFTSGDLSSAAMRDYAEVRNRANQESSKSAYALALVTRDYSSKSLERSELLEGIVENSEDIRDELRSNSLILLASYQQQAMTLASLNSLVEMTATEILTKNNNYRSSQGGTSAPQVRIDSDYSIDGSRRTVSATPEGQTVGEELPWLSGGGSNISYSGQTGTEAINQVVEATGSDGITMEEAQGWIDMAADIAEAAGYGDIADTFDNLSDAIDDTESNSFAVLWASAEAAAEMTGRDDLSELIGYASDITENPDGTATDEERLKKIIKVAQDAASDNGYGEYSDALGGMWEAYENGQVSASDMTSSAVSTYAYSTGSTDISTMINAQQDAQAKGTGASTTDMLSMILNAGSDIVDLTDNDDLKDYISGAKDALDIYKDAEEKYNEQQQQ